VITFFSQSNPLNSCQDNLISPKIDMTPTWILILHILYIRSCRMDDLGAQVNSEEKIHNENWKIFWSSE